MNLKILVINPVGHGKWDQSDKELFMKYAAPDTQIEVINLGKGPKSVETGRDFAEVLPLVIEKGLEYEKEFDAIIVNCFLDPGVDILKTLVKKPVVGPCEASLAIASILGWRFGIVTISSNDAIFMIEDRIRMLGYSDRLIAIKGIGIPVIELDKDIERTKRAVINCSRTLVKEYRAEVIILGCTGLAGISKDVEQEVHVPIVDPAIAALKVAEALVRMDLVHSRLRYI